MMLKTLLSEVSKQSINMRTWGISFVMNSLKILNLKPEHSSGLVTADFYEHLEKVVLAKIKEFTLHDLIKVLNSFYLLG